MGKSTLISAIKSRLKHMKSEAVTVVDLEDVATPDRRHFLDCLGALGNSVISTAAHLPTEQIPTLFGIVFLWTNDKTKYMQRVDERKAQDPGKADQDEDNIYDLMAKHVAGSSRILATIDTIVQSPDEGAASVLKLIGM